MRDIENEREFVALRCDRDIVSMHRAGETTLRITYPVETDRLDIYNQFLRPANIMPRRHKTIETTDIMMQMAASHRGVAAVPRWLAEEYADRMPLVSLPLGKHGIAKQIFLGIREGDATIDYLHSFVAFAREPNWLST